MHRIPILFLCAACACAQVPVQRTSLEHTYSATDTVAVMIPLSDGGAYAIAPAGGLTRWDARKKPLFSRPPIWTAATAQFFYARYHYREYSDGGMALARIQSSANACALLNPDGTIKFKKALTSAWVDIESAPTAKGGLLLAGSVEKNFYHDVQLLMIDGNGLTEWSAFVHWADENRLTALAPAEDGGFLLAGYTGPAVGRGAFSWLYRINGFGDSLWVDTTGYGVGEMIDIIAPRKSGGYLLGGQIPRLGIDNSDFWIQDIDPNGGVRREFIYGDRYPERISDLREMDDGDILAAGVARIYFGSNTQDPGRAGPFIQPCMQRLAPNGESRWSVLIKDTVDAMDVRVRSTGPSSYWIGAFLAYGTVSKSVTFGPEPPMPILLAGPLMRIRPVRAAYDPLGRPVAGTRGVFAYREPAVPAFYVGDRR